MGSGRYSQIGKQSTTTRPPLIVRRERLLTHPERKTSRSVMCRDVSLGPKLEPYIGPFRAVRSTTTPPIPFQVVPLTAIFSPFSGSFRFPSSLGLPKSFGFRDILTKTRTKTCSHFYLFGSHFSQNISTKYLLRHSYKSHPLVHLSCGRSTLVWLVSPLPFGTLACRFH